MNLVLVGMSYVKIGSWLYILLLFLPFVLCFVLYFVLKGRTSKFQFWFVFSLCLFGFLLHFVKQFFPFNMAQWPYSFRLSTFENLCAVLTLLFPVFFLWGGKILKDVMFYLGIICGLFAILFPPVNASGAMSQADAVMEIVRYYVCHYILIISGILTVVLGFHKLNYRRIWMMPIAFLCIMSIVFINEIFLNISGLVTSNMDEFLSADYRNAAFVFGIPSLYLGQLNFLNNLVPGFLRMHPYDPVRTYYFPVLWAIVPIFIAGLISCFCLSMPLEYKRLSQDIKHIFMKFAMIKEARRRRNNAEE